MTLDAVMRQKLKIKAVLENISEQRGNNMQQLLGRGLLVVTLPVIQGKNYSKVVVQTTIRIKIYDLELKKICVTKVAFPPKHEVYKSNTIPCLKTILGKFSRISAKLNILNTGKNNYYY